MEHLYRALDNMDVFDKQDAAAAVAIISRTIHENRTHDQAARDRECCMACGALCLPDEHCPGCAVARSGVA